MPDSAETVQSAGHSTRRDASDQHSGTTASSSGLSSPAIDPLLRGPIVPMMFRLGLPTVLVIVVQTLVGVAETYFVSFLGTDALAGVTLVFPVLMLMQMMANGGIGGGVAAAIARASGSGRRSEVRALVFHTLVLAFVLGASFMVAALLGGPWLYRALGGQAESLGAALTYSNIVFVGAAPLWVTALLAAALRGVGDVRVPAVISFGGALVLISLSPALIFGWGPLPRLGVAGAGTAVLVYYLLAAAILVAYVSSPRTEAQIRRARIEWRLFKEILGVGTLSALATVQMNLTVAMVTGAVGIYGAQAIAGYGIASRLDYLLVPLLFGFGTAVVTMVGSAVGANDIGRARRVAWTGACIGGGAAGTIGVAAAVFPQGWLKLFSDDAAVLSTGALYLHLVAPFYALLGAGMLLFFASQGAGRVSLPFLGGTARLLIAGIGGWIAAAWLGAGITELFALVAASTALFGIVCALAVWVSDWTARNVVTPAAPPAVRSPTPIRGTTWQTHQRRGQVGAKEAT